MSQISYLTPPQHAWEEENGIRIRALFKTHFLGIVIYFFILIGLLHLFTFQPSFGDDFINRRTVQRLGSLPRYVAHMYSQWTGRIPQATLLWIAFHSPISQACFKFLSFTVLLLTFVIAAAIPLGRTPRILGRDRLYFLLISATLWFGNPLIHETVFWGTGATAYLFSGFFFLSFLLPYLWVLLPKSDLCWFLCTPVRKAHFGVILLLLGFCTGSCHEQVMVATSIFLLVWSGLIFKRKIAKKLPWILYLGIAGFVLGALLLTLSPGNQIRLDYGNISISLSKQIKYGLTYLVHHLLNPQIVGWITATVLCLHLASKKPSTDKQCSDRLWIVILLVITGLGTLVPVFYLNYFDAGRTAYFALLCMAIACGLGLAHYESHSFPLPSELQKLYIIILALVLSEISVASYESFTLNHSIRDRHKSIIRQARNGTAVVVKKLPPIKNRLIYISDSLAQSNEPVFPFASTRNTISLSSSPSGLLERTWAYPYGYHPKNLLDSMLINTYGLLEASAVTRDYYALTNQAICELYGIRSIALHP